MKPESRRPFALARPATIAAPQQVPAPPERLADSGTSEGIAGGDERPPQPRRDMKPESLRPAAAARAEAVAAPQQVPPLPEKRAVSDRAQVIAEGDGQGLAPSVASEAPKQLAVAEPEALGTYLEQLRRRWTEVIDGVGVVNKLLQAVVRSCGPYEAHAGALIIGCDSVFHKDKVGQGQNRRVLEKVVAEVLGVRVTLEFDVVPRHKRGQPPAPTSDPLVKEVLSWGGRIKAVVSDNPDGDSAVGDASDGGVIVATDRKTRSDEEVNGES